LKPPTGGFIFSWAQSDDFLRAGKKGARQAQPRSSRSALTLPLTPGRPTPALVVVGRGDNL
jgi:hypothetical protein